MNVTRNIKELFAAVDATLRNALDCVDVHPCDYDNDDIRSKGLSEELKRLYDIRKNVTNNISSKSEKDIKKECLQEVSNELFSLSKKYKNNDKREGVQDAYAHVIGLRNSIK